MANEKLSPKNSLIYISQMSTAKKFFNIHSEIKSKDDLSQSFLESADHKDKIFRKVLSARRRNHSDSDIQHDYDQEFPLDLSMKRSLSLNTMSPENDKMHKKHEKQSVIYSENSSKSYNCYFCQRSFSRSDMLTRHVRLHTGIKPYTCQVCSQVFSRSDHLSTHQRTHTGEKPYKCPCCSYAACRRDMITRHMRTHAKHSSKYIWSSMTTSDMTSYNACY